MKARIRNTISATWILLSLLATFSTSGAQAPSSLGPPEPQMAPLRSEVMEPLLLPTRPVIITQEEPSAPDVEYFAVETKTLGDGRSIDQVTINGPPTPPQGFERSIAESLEASPEAGLVTLSEVPAYDWSYGCSATSAAMIAAYYDRTLYPNMYTGPTNGGVMPMDNSVWGHTTWPSCDGPGTTSVGECPLSATHSGIDGRSTKGHVDDYWTGYACSGPDPYVTDGWSEHTPGDCTGDFMKTSKWFSEHSLNRDGETVIFFYSNGAQTPTSDLSASDPPYSYDGGVGIELFYESRGYEVTTAYNQYIRGQGSNPSLGFTYEQYKAEIDAGRPVMVHLEGHTVVGVGYDDTSSDLMFIHDTWDYDTHSMTWGASYSGMNHVGVTIVQLEGVTAPPPTVTSITPSSGFNTGVVHITNLTGDNFQTGASIKLARAGQTDISATNVTVVSASTITCDFDLTGAATGLWSVVVENPDSQSGTLLNSFTVKTPGGEDHLVYLPLVSRRWPPIPDIPVLNPINNSDGDGNYDVSWSSAYLANTYTLQEDDNAAFSSPFTAYSGSRTSTSITGNAPGTYYYRVKASNSVGHSSWSNVRQVTVQGQARWITILTENFEGPFPGGAWEVRDNDPDSGRYYWGKRNCRDHGGSFSAWSVGAGDTTLSCGSNYRNDVYAWMTYGPFSLADATAAELTFDWWSDTEYRYDGFFWGASTNDDDYYGTLVTGDWSSWTTGEVLHLSDVPTLGNLLGEDQVWIAFVFGSDSSITDKGSFVDNVSLRKRVGAAVTRNERRVSPRHILEPNQTMEFVSLRLDQAGGWRLLEETH